METSEVFTGALGARASRPHYVGAALAAARDGQARGPAPAFSVILIRMGIFGHRIVTKTVPIESDQSILSLTVVPGRFDTR